MDIPPQDPKPSLKDRLKKAFDSIFEKNRMDRIYNQASSNMRDTLAYVLMLTGLLLLFYEPAYAGALIGVIFGLYFSSEIVYLFKNYQQIVDREGLTRSLLLAGLFIAFFICAPFIFFGAIVAVAVKQLLE